MRTRGQGSGSVSVREQAEEGGLWLAGGLNPGLGWHMGSPSFSSPSRADAKSVCGGHGQVPGEQPPSLPPRPPEPVPSLLPLPPQPRGGVSSGSDLFRTLSPAGLAGINVVLLRAEVCGALQGSRRGFAWEVSAEQGQRSRGGVGIWQEVRVELERPVGLQLLLRSRLRRLGPRPGTGRGREPCVGAGGRCFVH